MPESGGNQIKPGHHNYFSGDCLQIPEFESQVSPYGQEEPRCRDAASNERKEINHGSKD
jgi:hypothetical protein